MSVRSRTLWVCLSTAVLLVAGCKDDVGPRQKAVSDRIHAKEGKLWAQAHVLAVRRVEKGKYGGRGGFGSYQRGFMRYHLLFEGQAGPRRVFLYEAPYRREEGEGKGVDRLLLKGSADDRCVAYSRDGGREWRFVRFVAEAGPIHFEQPKVALKEGASDPCASAPALDAHFLALLDTKGWLRVETLENVLGFLETVPGVEAHQLAFARFVTTAGRRQSFHPELKERWRSVQRIACATSSVRRVYLDALALPQGQGPHPHLVALRVLERCPEAAVQDAAASLLLSPGDGMEREELRLVAARTFARITEERRGASPKAAAAAMVGLPTAEPRVQTFLARALGTIGSASARAALRDFVAKAGAFARSRSPGDPCPGTDSGLPPRADARSEWPAFDRFVEREQETPFKERAAFAVRTAQAALRRPASWR